MYINRIQDLRSKEARLIAVETLALHESYQIWYNYLEYRKYYATEACTKTTELCCQSGHCRSLQI